MRLKLVLFLFVIILIGVFFAIESALAQDTFATRPSPITMDEHFYQELYRTDFNTLYDWQLSEWPTPLISVPNGELHITGDQMAFEGVWVQSRNIDYFTSDFLYDGYAYEVIFEFTPKNVNQNFFRVFYNGEIDIWLSGHAPMSLETYSSEGPGITTIQTVIPGNQYNIRILAWHRQGMNNYHITIDDSPVGFFQYTLHAADQKVKLGDFAQLDTGGGEWNFLEINGWSNAQYFNNFNDDSAHEFQKIHADMNGDVLLKAENGNLKILSYDTIGPPFSLFNTYAYTEFINFDPIESWRMSLDFWVQNNGFDRPNNFVLLKNRQVMLTLHNDGLYWFDGQYHLIMNIQGYAWYFLEVEKTAPNQYKVIVNTHERAIGCSFESQNPIDWWNYLGIGCFGSASTPLIKIDDLKLIVETRTHADSDGDGMGDAFENGPEPYIYIWSTDFEDIPFFTKAEEDRRDLDLEETGWDFDNPALDGPGDVSQWEKGEPLAGPWIGHADGIYPGSIGKVIGTDLDGNYDVNIDQHALQTPVIPMDNVIDSVTITLWHWYDTELDEDGGRIKISDDGGASYSLLGSYQDPYNTQQVTSLDDGPGFTGTSPDWEFLEFTLDNTYVGPGKSLRLKFEFGSDGDDDEDGAGWYIDDIKIYGKSHINNNDYDEDDLNDGTEYSLYCSSPFLSDTDGDSISDKDEVSKDCLAKFSFYNSDVETWSDPLIKDVWVEVDRMKNLPCGWQPAISDPIHAKFEIHVIYIHFITSDWIDKVDTITWSQARDYGRLKSVGGKRETGSDQYYHYLLWANKLGADVLGESYNSRNSSPF